ncbi:MAG: orotidine 5-phosphate decarboxylase [Sulfitobacter sp.]
MNTLNTITPRYNPANGCFEALVQLDDAVSYACAIRAPLSMSEEKAARALYQKARRMHGNPASLRATRHDLPQLCAAPRPATWRNWLGAP